MKSHGNDCKAWQWPSIIPSTARRGYSYQIHIQQEISFINKRLPSETPGDIEDTTKEVVTRHKNILYIEVAKSKQYIIKIFFPLTCTFHQEIFIFIYTYIQNPIFM